MSIFRASQECVSHLRKSIIAGVAPWAGLDAISQEDNVRVTLLGE